MQLTVIPFQNSVINTHFATVSDFLCAEPVYRTYTRVTASVTHRLLMQLCTADNDSFYTSRKSKINLGNTVQTTFYKVNTKVNIRKFT